jgi:hypothetical protein
MGSEATLTLAALEACRNEALRKLAALDAQRPAIAHSFCTTNSALALQKWRAIDDEADRLLEAPSSVRCRGLPCTRACRASGLENAVETNNENGDRILTSSLRR